MDAGLKEVLIAAIGLLGGGSAYKVWDRWLSDRSKRDTARARLEQSDRDRLWEQMQDRIETLEAKVGALERKIEKLEEERVENLEEIARLKLTVAERDARITALELAIAKKDSDNDVLESQVQEYEREIARLKGAAIAVGFERLLQATPDKPS